VLSALLRSGWRIERQSGSHRVLRREGSPDVVFAFHDGEEIGPRMLARIARQTGLRPEGLSQIATNAGDGVAIPHAIIIAEPAG
jgi:predicted RNA binding protein YcfA (HicA-like mRNA interferase family)